VAPRAADRLSAFCFATQIKEDNQVFHVFSANAEADRTLLTALDLQPDGFAARRNIAYDLKHQRSILARRLLMGGQVGLLGSAVPTAIEPADLADASPMARSRLSFDRGCMACRASKPIAQSWTRYISTCSVSMSSPAQ
jgi:hypothetical protein